MGWNYRVMRHAPNPVHRDRGDWYAIHEVYYQDDSVDDRAVQSSETGYTQDPITVVAGDMEELRGMLEQMLAALDKPVLEYLDSPP